MKDIFVSHILCPPLLWELFTNLYFAVAMLFTTLICLAVVLYPIRSGTGTDSPKYKFNSGEKK
jgi:hypothetical protein